MTRSPCNALRDEVAAAHIEVPSSPPYAANMLFSGSGVTFSLAARAISDTRVPYAFNKLGVNGNTPSKRAPSLRAVTCSKYWSAFGIVDSKFRGRVSQLVKLLRSLALDQSEIKVDVGSSKSNLVCYACKCRLKLADRSHDSIIGSTGHIEGFARKRPKLVTNGALNHCI